jgi:hypothetical protein
MSVSKAGPTVSFIALDWDDTLCPTTWLLQQIVDSHGNLSSKNARLSMVALESSAIKLLKTAIALVQPCGGFVAIVSNSKSGWINRSSERFMPRLHAFIHRRDNITQLATRCVEIVHAQAMHRAMVRTISSAAAAATATAADEHLPTNLRTVQPVGDGEDTLKRSSSPMDWKATAFTAQLRRLADSCETNSPLALISIGDSDAERLAASRVCSNTTTTSRVLYCRSLKIQPRLSALELHHAHRIVIVQLKKLVFSKEKSIDLHLSVNRRKRKCPWPTTHQALPRSRNTKSPSNSDGSFVTPPSARSPLGSISNGQRTKFFCANRLQSVNN